MREQGFYWVREKTRWVVVESCEDKWYYPGIDYLLEDEDFLEIGEKVERE